MVLPDVEAAVTAMVMRWQRELLCNSSMDLTRLTIPCDGSRNKLMRLVVGAQQWVIVGWWRAP